MRIIELVISTFLTIKFAFAFMSRELTQFIQAFVVTLANRNVRYGAHHAGKMVI